MLFQVAVICIFGVESSTAPYQYDGDALYSFAYAVQDAYTGQDFGHSEERVKDLVTGQYHVLLPDGRVQLVKYKADGYGYVADVSYTEGAYKPAHGQGGTYVKGHANPVANGHGGKGYAGAYPPPPAPYQPVGYDLSGYSAYLPAGYAAYVPVPANGAYPAYPYPLAAQYGLKPPCDH